MFLINRAGALRGVVKLLQDNGIRVLGLSVQDSVDVTNVRLVLSDPESAESLFMERGIPYGACEVIVLELAGGADDLDRCLGALLSAETNVNFLYPLLTRPNGKATIALHVEDVEIASGVLATGGFKLLRQNDLSR